MTIKQKDSDLAALRESLHNFATERNWGEFHTPKNLATALSVEAAELLEPFQWLATGSVAELGTDTMSAVRLEMADVFAYLIMLADKLDVDLIEALKEKIQINALKYPVETAFGNAKKSTDYKN